MILFWAVRGYVRFHFITFETDHYVYESFPLDLIRRNSHAETYQTLLLRFLRHINVSKNNLENMRVISKLYSEIGVALTRLIDSRTGFVALCYSEKDVDTILSGGSVRSLKEIGLEPRMPPEVVAQRSVICRRIDPYVGTHTPSEIKNQDTNGVTSQK